MEILRPFGLDTETSRGDMINSCSKTGVQSSKASRNAFFFHIPKTGGTSVLSQLKSKYKNPFVQEAPQDWRIFDESLERFDFISGHFPVARFLDKVPDYYFRFAFLRNPLTHLASQIAHIALPCTITDEKKAYLVDRARRQTIDEFLITGGGEQFQILFDNPQIRFILGISDEPLGRSHINRAIEVLEALDFVGTVESIAGSLSILGSRLGIEGLIRSTRVNTNPHNAFDLQTVDRKTLLAVSHRTWFDSVLFEYFTNRLARQLSAEPGRQLRQPAAVGRTVQLADLFRTITPVLMNVTLGDSYKILEDEVFLHAPDVGYALAELIDVDLAGIDQLDGQVMIKGEYSRPIFFGLTISNDGGVLFAIEVSADCDHPVVLKAAFPPLPSTVTLRATTRMRDADACNSFAWSTFKSVSFSGLG